MTSDGDLFIDIDIEDYKDESIKSFAKLVSSLGTVQLQLETAQIASSGISEAMPEKLELFISEITRRATKALEASEIDDEIDEEIEDKPDGEDDKPCIRPSDLL